MNTFRFKNKFCPPEQPEATIPRNRLLDLADGGPARRLTAIVASAGYGKTTLAAGLVRKKASPFLWINLDRRDGEGAAIIQLVLRGLIGLFKLKNYPTVSGTELRSG
ncbi:MAG: hypothetical protein ACOY31_09195 [Bacillota bacterium]